MSNIVLGIDISSKNIKLALVKTGKKPTIIKSAVLPLNEAIVFDGDIRNPEALAAQIKGMIVQKKLKAREVCFSVDSSHVVIREMKLPPLKKEEVETAVAFAVSQSFPGVANTHTISFKHYETDAEGLKGIAAFCPNKILDGYMQLANLIGMPVRSIDVNASSIVKAFNTFDENQKDGAVLLINIGHSNSQVNVISDGKLLISRNVSTGAGNIDSILAGRLDVTQEQAERIRLKNKFKDYGVTDEDIETLVRLGLNSVEEQIRQTLDYYAYNISKEGIRNIFISGEGSQLEAISRYFRDALNVTVSRIRADQKDIQDDTAQFLLCAAGAALNDIKAVNDLNLMPYLKTMEKNKAKTGRMFLSIASAGIVLVLAIGAYAFMYFMQRQLEGKQEKLQQSIKSYSEVNKLKNRMIENDKKITEMGSILTAYANNSISGTSVLSDLTGQIPENIFLLNLSTSTGGDLVLSGKSKDTESIAYLIRRLKQSGRFSSINVKGINSRVSENGAAEDYTFSASIKIGK